MGITPSLEKSGTCYIQTDLPFYMAGDTVTGKVYVNILENFPSNVVTLKIKGFEK